MLNNKESIEQSMLAQQVYLDILRSRHLLWASATDDPEIKRAHTQLAELILQAREQYFDLINSYHAHDEKYRMDIHSFSIPNQLYK